MQKGHVLHLECQRCKNALHFSVFELEKKHHLLTCEQCGQNYDFNDDLLKRQLLKFEKLCRQILESEEILSDTHVGISVGGKNIKVPYKLLLTRFNSLLDLVIGGKPMSIEFRLEPLKDLPPPSSHLRSHH